jgi:hypothetical protein
MTARPYLSTARRRITLIDNGSRRPHGRERAEHILQRRPTSTDKTDPGETTSPAAHAQLAGRMDILGSAPLSLSIIACLDRAHKHRPCCCSRQTPQRQASPSHHTTVSFHITKQRLLCASGATTGGAAGQQRMTIALVHRPLSVVAASAVPVRPPSPASRPSCPWSLKSVNASLSADPILFHPLNRRLVRHRRHRLGRNLGQRHRPRLTRLRRQALEVDSGAVPLGLLLERSVLLDALEEALP